MADQDDTPAQDAGYWQQKIIDAVAGHGVPALTFERLVGYTQELVVLARIVAASKAPEDGPVASELDIEMENMLKAANPLIEVARPAPPPSAHGGAPSVIPPAGVYGNKVLGTATIAPWPTLPKVGVFYSRTGSTWFSVEGTTSFDRTMADEHWTFMGWLELRSVPSA